MSQNDAQAFYQQNPPPSHDYTNTENMPNSLNSIPPSLQQQKESDRLEKSMFLFLNIDFFKNYKI